MGTLVGTNEESMQNDFIKIRASADLLKGLKQESRRQGISVSELVRRALGQYLISRGIKREYTK